MPAAVIGGNIAYPNLQQVADLFRASINDTFTGATDTVGEGLIMTNENPDLLAFMDSAIRDLYTDLRNIGDPALILDNYILEGLPALAQPNPAVQVSIAYQGYFDGFQWHPEWVLPISCQRVLRLWERWSGTDLPFTPMTPCPQGLPGTWQGQAMGYWEMRQNAVWMPGCLVPIDIRMRMRINFPDFLNPVSIDFNTAYIPILGCTNAIVAKMLCLYARRFAPDMKPMADADDIKFMGKLKLEVVRQRQWTENQRVEWGEEAQSGYGFLAQL